MAQGRSTAGALDRRTALRALAGAGLCAALPGLGCAGSSGLLSVTSGPADLTIPPDGDMYRYGLGYVFQIDATRAGLFANLRTEGLPVGDFEAGMDLLIFDDPSRISSAEAHPLTRNEHYVDDATGRERLIVKHDQKGGFVPAGAKRADGSDHPHAGTGFLLGAALDFAREADGSYVKADKAKTMVRNMEIHHLEWDGARMKVLGTEFRDLETPIRSPDGKWTVFEPGMRMAIPDGDDLVMGLGATGAPEGLRPQEGVWMPEPMCAGFSRWRRIDGRWRMTGFVPVAESTKAEEPVAVYGQSMSILPLEPTVVRDVDGSLLFTVRSAYSDYEDHVVRIWRSTDGGVSWDLIIEEPNARGQAPVTLNQAVDGTPYLILSAYGRERDRLVIRKLNENRDGLEDPILIRDAVQDFGPPPVGPVWFVDHSQSTAVRLADGKWHDLIVYRVMDRGEHAGKPPAAETGLYVEEAIWAGKPLPCWKF